MRLRKGGPKPNVEKRKLIFDLRRQKKTISEIANLLGTTKQVVSYYICRYGDPLEKSYPQAKT